MAYTANKTQTLSNVNKTFKISNKDLPKASRIFSNQDI